MSVISLICSVMTSRYLLTSSLGWTASWIFEDFLRLSKWALKACLSFLSSSNWCKVLRAWGLYLWEVLICSWEFWNSLVGLTWCAPIDLTSCTEFCWGGLAPNLTEMVDIRSWLLSGLEVFRRGSSKMESSPCWDRAAEAFLGVHADPSGSGYVLLWLVPISCCSLFGDFSWLWICIDGISELLNTWPLSPPGMFSRELLRFRVSKLLIRFPIFFEVLITRSVCIEDRVMSITRLFLSSPIEDRMPLLPCVTLVLSWSRS